MEDKWMKAVAHSNGLLYSLKRCVLGQEDTLLLQCFSLPRWMNRYRRISCWEQHYDRLATQPGRGRGGGNWNNPSRFVPHKPEKTPGLMDAHGSFGDFIFLPLLIKKAPGLNESPPYLGALLADCLIKLAVWGSAHRSNGVFPSWLKKLMFAPWRAK